MAKKKSAGKPSKAATKALEQLNDAGAVKHRLLVLPASGGGDEHAEEEVDVEIDAEAFEAWINGVPLDLTNGKVSQELLPGHHLLTFKVRGAPGTKWSVKITAPKEAKNEDGDTFGNSGFDVGRMPFVVGP